MDKGFIETKDRNKRQLYKHVAIIATSKIDTDMDKLQLLSAIVD